MFDNFELVTIIKLITMNWQKSLKQYEDLVKLFPSITLKGKTMPYTSLNGHMFSFLDKDGKMGLRLPELERSKFIQENKSGLMEQHGRIMKEYVIVPDKLIKNTDKLSKYFEQSIKYVSSLKPKSTKKKS